jgi:hypothetical protein
MFRSRKSRDGGTSEGVTPVKGIVILFDKCQQVASLVDLQFSVQSVIGLQYAGGVDRISPCSHSLRQLVTYMRHRHMAGEFVSARQVALAA